MRQDFRDELMRLGVADGFGVTFRRLRPIEVGAYTISAQASSTHYSTPRETLADLYVYSAWELAIFHGRGKGRKWCSPDTCPEVFDGIDVAGHWEWGLNPVGVQVPTAQVQALYERLIALEGGDHA